jgi:hypothetical protein
LEAVRMLGAEEIARGGEIARPDVVRGIVFVIMFPAPEAMRCAGTACGGTWVSAIGGPRGGPTCGRAAT